tara:strand:- start:26 stop:754 length:729 start_codon:yes stop_codon:yes gene_type:complete
MKANRFTIVMPTRNAEMEVARSLYSIWAQTHPNWKIVIIDDASDDKTLDEIERFQTKFRLPEDRLKIISNSTQQYALPNILTGIEEADESDIICHIDGDDWLCDMDALSLINMRYEKTPSIQALWTSQRWGFSHYNISGALPQDADPYTHPWVSSHMKTFRASTFRDISDSNFRNEDGSYFQRVADQALYLPVLHKAEGNWFHEPFTAYHYSIEVRKDIFQNQDAKFQKQEADFLRIRGFLS